MSKKLIIFEIICVLIVIGIIGYTYSFFSVTTKNDSVIYGEAASVNLTLTVTKLSPGNTKGLVPQLDDYITKAVIGRKGSCVDDNNNNVCQVYKITLKNNGSSSVFVTGTLALDAKNNPNLKWAEITDTTEPELKSMINKNSYSLLTSNEFYNANEEKNYYIVVWISETGLIQTDNGTFSGVVKFENTDGVPLPAETLEEVTTRQEATSNFLSSNIARQDIESIEFIKKSDLPTGVSNPIDVTYDKTNNANSVQLYSVLNNDTSKYKIYIASDSGTIYLKSGYILFSKLTNMTSIDLTNVDTSKVTTMYGMFNYCQSLTSLDVSNWNTLNVINMAGMFNKCENLTSLDLSAFDTTKVTDMSYMFNFCYKLETINVSSFDTSKVTTMQQMFNSCEKLTSLDLSNFNTSKVTDMSYMFNRCYKLESVNVSSFNTSNVTTIAFMFSECYELNNLDVSNWNTSSVRSMYATFQSCNKLTSLDVSSWNTSKVTSMRLMFFQCYLLSGLDVSNFDTSNVTDMHGMFDNCKSLTTLDVGSFNTSKVTTMKGMFEGCEKLTSLDVSNFNTLKVTDMSYMFNKCKSLTSLNVSNFDTSNVTAMAWMFSECYLLSDINLNSFNTSKVTNTQSMFCNCTTLTSLDISSFDTSNVTNMSYMFGGDKATMTLNKIYVSDKFVTTNVTDGSNMFKECNSLVGGNGTVFDSNNIDKTYARIDSSSTPGYFTLKV